MCDGKKKKKLRCFAMPLYQPQQIFPFAFLCLLEFTVVLEHDTGARFVPNSLSSSATQNFASKRRRWQRGLKF